jgi:hypothetical protein
LYFNRTIIGFPDPKFCAKIGFAIKTKKVVFSKKDFGQTKKVKIKVTPDPNYILFVLSIPSSIFYKYFFE